MDTLLCKLGTKKGCLSIFCIVPGVFIRRNTVIVRPMDFMDSLCTRHQGDTLNPFS